MIQKIKNIALALVLPFAVTAPLTLAPVVLAAPATGFTNCNNIKKSLVNGVNSSSNGAGTNCSGDVNDTTGAGSLPELASKVVNFLSVLVGIVAVIMIIVGGFRYITSGGESGNVSGAKNTLIYAIVGLIIVALAQFIVKFVLTNVAGA